jgi:hypothetical protein
MGDEGWAFGGEIFAVQQASLHGGVGAQTTLWHVETIPSGKNRLKGPYGTIEFLEHYSTAECLIVRIAMQMLCKLVFIMLVLKARRTGAAVLETKRLKTQPRRRNLIAAPAAPLQTEAAGLAPGAPARAR